MRRAWRLLWRRAISSVPVLILVIVGTFLLLENASGDAADAYLVAIGGGDAGFVSELRQQYGLDRSVWVRLGFYV